jgi:hypothetical protein
MAFRTTALAQRPRVTPRVARLMGLRGLADYSVITPGGARISYTGNPPGTPATTGGAVTRPRGTLNRQPQIPYADGTLIQGTGDSATYLMQNGQKCWIPDINTFWAMGFEQDQIVRNVPDSVMNSIPTGPTLPQIVPATSTPAAPAAAASSAAGTVSTVMETGAVFDSVTGYYTNPDGSIYYPPTSASNYVSSGTFTSTLEQGATYDAATGYYVNPDGTIYDPSSASTAFDITSPSTWPTWVWLALGVGGTWLVFLKKGR